MHIAAAEAARNDGERGEIVGDAPMPAAHAGTAGGDHGAAGGHRLGFGRLERVDGTAESFRVGILRGMGGIRGEQGHHGDGLRFHRTTPCVWEVRVQGYNAVSPRGKPLRLQEPKPRIR